MSAKIIVKKSVKSVKSVSIPKGVEMSEKFAKELAKFFIWAAHDISIVNGDSEPVSWDMSLLEGVDYTEAPRMKLEKALEVICDYHTITKHDSEISKKDIKELIKEFKPKKIAKAESDSEPEIAPKKAKKVAKVEETEEPKKAKKVEEEPKKAKGSRTPKVNWKLDTEETEWIDILDYSTEQLVKVFGEPKITGEDDDDHEHEWKIEMNGKSFSIYDWENDQEFDDKEWHVAGPTEKTSIKSLIKYIGDQIGETEQSGSDSE